MEDPVLDYDDTHESAELDKAEDPQTLQSVVDGEAKISSEADHTLLHDVDFTELLGKTKGCISAGGISYLIAGSPAPPVSGGPQPSPAATSPHGSGSHRSQARRKQRRDRSRSQRRSPRRDRSRSPRRDRDRGGKKGRGRSPTYHEKQRARQYLAGLGIPDVRHVRETYSLPPSTMTYTEAVHRCNDNLIQILKSML